jgi:hypothetical protein
MSFQGDSPERYVAAVDSSVARQGQSIMPFPVFAKSMFFVDLVLCTLRLPLVVFRFLGYAALQHNRNLMVPIIAAELLTGLGIAIFGIPANICALVRKPWSIPLSWLTVTITLGSVGVALWLATYKMAELGPPTAQTAGGYIGIGFGLIVRLAWLAMYVGALVQFSRWVKRRLPTITSHSS